MTLQAYMDESVDETGIIVIAGYVSTAEKWLLFSEAWREELVASGVQSKSGVFRFKMSEMALSPARMEKVAQFHRIIQEHVLMSVSFTLNRHDLKRAIERISVDNIQILWEPPLTPYYMTFRLFMESFHNARTEKPDASGWDWLKILDGPIDFFFDDTSEKRPILEGWSEYLDTRNDAYRGMYGATPRFEDDDIFLPLQAADFRAWWVRRWAKEHGLLHAGAGSYFGFSRSPKLIPHLSLAADEDTLARFFKGWAEQNIGVEDNYFKVRDSKFLTRNDPTPPLQRVLASFGRWARRWSQ